jgi:hypothetical protein
MFFLSYSHSLSLSPGDFLLCPNIAVGAAAIFLGQQKKLANMKFQAEERVAKGGLKGDALVHWHL